MNTKKVLQILENAQAKGAAIEIDLKTFPYYLKYKKEKNVERKIKYGIQVVQELINVSNLDKAEEFLNELEKISFNEKYMGAIWEKRGWIADCRTNYDDEIKYFKKAKQVYEKVPGAIEIEGHAEDRILTCEHFMARALYFRGRKEDLDECIKLFSNNLEGYKKLKSNDAIAFNYSWLARICIAKKDYKKAEKYVKECEKYFEKAVRKNGPKIKTYIFRIKSELAQARGEKEEAIKYSLEAIRFALPSGAYYNGVIEALVPIVKSLS